MALFENFPYTNMHELNLDWLINEIKKIESTQVLSVNGQTGEVILYQDAQMLLPSVTDDHWSIGRMTDGTYRGIMFGNDNKAYIVHGNMMSQIYGVNNPPPYPVTSVNGETGDVILYSSASVQLPGLNDAQLRNWNLWRDLNGIMRGIQFDDTGKAYLIAGSNRYDFYTSNNPPAYPVTSVNGQTGAVTLNIPDAFVDNPAAGELTIAEEIPDSSVWALLRETENGYIGIAVNNGVNPAAYLQIGTGATAQRIQLLTNADIPASAGVVSINGMTGVVTINGSQIAVSGSDGRTITAALAALDSAVSSAENDIDNIRAAMVYDENGNTTAANNIPSGSFVFWNNGAYKSTSTIAIGNTLSSTNLSAISAGGFTNEIIENLETLIPPANITIATLCQRASQLNVNAVFLFALNSANSNTLVSKTGAGYGIGKVSDDGIRFTYFQPANSITTHGIINPSTQAVTIYEQYGSISSLGMQTVTVSNSTAIAAGSYLEVESAYAPSGYKVLGVAGWQITGPDNGAFTANRVFYENGRITATFRNVSTSSSTPSGVTFYMLCIAN